MTLASRLRKLEAQAAEADRGRNERPGPMTVDERRARLVASLEGTAAAIAAEARGPRGERPHAPPTWREAFAARVERHGALWLWGLLTSRDDDDARTMYRGVADTWCPRANGREHYRESAAERARFEARLRELAAPMRRPPDPEPATIPELLAWYDYGGA